MTSDPAARPLRRDAERNRELLLAAARRAFAERGLDVALEEIARRAGVSIGTLYNRFPTRDALIEATFTDRLERMIALAEEALTGPDPWDGFAAYLTGICELQAADRGYNEVAARGMPSSPVTTELQARGYRLVQQIMARAQEAGGLRADVTVEDLLFVVLGNSRTVAVTAEIAPGLWRRHLGLMLDGFRTAGAHALPEPPLTPGRVHQPHGRDAH